VEWNRVASQGGFKINNCHFAAFAKEEVSFFRLAQTQAEVQDGPYDYSPLSECLITASYTAFLLILEAGLSLRLFSYFDFLTVCRYLFW
jgi:hypothetical protein